jgi:hypothetical protein
VRSRSATSTITGSQQSAADVAAFDFAATFRFAGGFVNVVLRLAGFGFAAAFASASPGADFVARTRDVVRRTLVFVCALRLSFEEPAAARGLAAMR